MNYVMDFMWINNVSIRRKSPIKTLQSKSKNTDDAASLASNSRFELIHTQLYL